MPYDLGPAARQLSTFVDEAIAKEAHRVFRGIHDELPWRRLHFGNRQVRPIVRDGVDVIVRSLCRDMTAFAFFFDDQLRSLVIPPLVLAHTYVDLHTGEAMAGDGDLGIIHFAWRKDLTPQVLNRLRLEIPTRDHHGYLFRDIVDCLKSDPAAGEVPADDPRMVAADDPSPITSAPTLTIGPGAPAAEVAAQRVKCDDASLQERICACLLEIERSRPLGKRRKLAIGLAQDRLPDLNAEWSTWRRGWEMFQQARKEALERRG